MDLLTLYWDKHTPQIAVYFNKNKHLYVWGQQAGRLQPCRWVDSKDPDGATPSMSNLSYQTHLTDK